MRQDDNKQDIVARSQAVSVVLDLLLDNIRPPDAAIIVRFSLANMFCLSDVYSGLSF